MQCSQYFCNIFIRNPKLQVVTSKKKNDFNGKFKLELVKTYQLGFVVKVLQKYCGHSTSQKLSKQKN